MRKNKPAKIIYGTELFLARTGVILTIMGLALRTVINPVKAVRVLKKIAGERRSIHNNTGEFKAVRSGGKYYWSVNLPGWPSANFSETIINEVRKAISGSPGKMQTIIFGITNKCPLNCIHCYEWDNISNTDTLSLQELKRITDMITGSGINHIHFGGGEPMSRFDDMIALMDYSGNRCEYWLNTCGAGLTSDKARLMKARGMTGAIISLDDWNEDRHNRFRDNPRSYKWALEAARNCNDAGMIVCLSLCPVRQIVNFDDLDKYLTLAKDSGVSFIRIMEPRDAGRFSGSSELLTEEEFAVIDGYMTSRNNDPSFRGFPIIQFPAHHARKSGCTGSGIRYLYIDPNGNYHSCPFCRDDLGNALDKTIEEARQTALTKGCQAFRKSSLDKAI